MANRGVKAGPALYLYGISKSLAPDTGIEVESIDGVHPVRFVPCGEYACWVSDVEGADFTSSFERKMEDLDWLALHGVRHQQVVGEIASRSSIVPARFGTVFSGEEALLKNVSGRKAALKKVFSRIEGADEWGVKVFAQPAPVPEAPKEVHSGKDYLQQKAARLKRRPERDDSGVKQLSAQLEKIAAASAPTGKVSGGLPNLVWQAAFLVPRSRRRQWDRALQEFVDQWGAVHRIEVNGPWPPYSFVADAE